MSTITAETPIFTTRFAPSPSGLLHKGHAYSALLAYKIAIENKGRFLVRIEDIDTGRCKPAFTQAILADLKWLGLTWEEPVRIQSENFTDYEAALDMLKKLDVVYPCFCTRKEIQDEISSSKRAPHGPDGPLYPGTCRHLDKNIRAHAIANGRPHAWRLNLSKALTHITTPLVWHEQCHGLIPAQPDLLGDCILARKDTPTSYHLSVVVDDALQGVTHIVRGEDLYYATHLHVVLQQLLGLPTPQYQHHALLMDETGVRYAKRNKAVTLQSIRENGIDSASLKASLGF